MATHKVNTPSYLASQGYALVNDAYNEFIGTKNSGALNTTDLVTMGKNLEEIDGYDGFYGALTNKVAKTVTYVLNYVADGRKILDDSITYGAFIERVYIDDLDAVENEVYNETSLVNGTQSGNAPKIDPYGVTKVHKITSKLFGCGTTWAYEFKTDLEPLKKAFLNESSMIAFVDGIFTKSKTDVEIEKESVINTAVNTAIGLAFENSDTSYNLYAEYNAKHSDAPMTSIESAHENANYLKWCNKRINQIIKLMSKPTKKYNASKYLNASKRDNLTVEVLSQWAENSKVFLESGTYHDDKVALCGNYSEVEFWQFADDDFTTASTVSVTHADINDGNELTKSGIVCVARDNECVRAIFNIERQYSIPNPRTGAMIHGYQFAKGYAVEPHANCVVFYESET